MKLNIESKGDTARCRLVEAVDAARTRTKVKRRKARTPWMSLLPEAKSRFCRRVSCIGDGFDLSKFFDTVSHDRLMHRLSTRVEDKSVLSMIRGMLQAKIVMPNGVVRESREGTPQGGPLGTKWTTADYRKAGKVKLSTWVTIECKARLVARAKRESRSVADLLGELSED